MDLWNIGSSANDAQTEWTYAPTSSGSWPIDVGSKRGEDLREVGLYIPGEGSIDRIPPVVSALLVTAGAYDFDLTGGGDLATVTFAGSVDLGSFDSDNPLRYAGGPIESISDRFEFRRRFVKSGPNTGNFRWDGLAGWETGIERSASAPYALLRVVMFQGLGGPNGSLLFRVDYHADHDVWDLTDIFDLVAADAGGGVISFLDEADNPAFVLRTGLIDVMGYDLSYWSSGPEISGTIGVSSHLTLSHN